MNATRSLVVGGMLAVLATAIGCSSAPPLPSPSPTSSPTPSFTPPPSPTPTVATQDAILGAVARWLPDGLLTGRGGSVYVDEAVSDAFGSHHFGPDSHQPDLLHVGPPLFGEAMTGATKRAVEEALQPIVPLEFVADRTSVVDAEAPDHLGCRPYLGSRSMLRLGPPRLGADGTRYFVFVNVDHGCAGFTYVVQVNRTGERFEVTRVVETSQWIV